MWQPSGAYVCYRCGQEFRYRYAVTWRLSVSQAVAFVRAWLHGCAGGLA